MDKNNIKIKLITPSERIEKQKILSRLFYENKDLRVLVKKVNELHRNSK